MIAYYAHQHGSGHCTFAERFAKAANNDILIFTSYDFNFSSRTQVVRLPSEDPDNSSFEANQIEEPAFLHYSPVGQKSIQERSRKFLEAYIKHKCKCLIVDVSAEVAALARASSIPFIYVKLPGYRNDSAHLQAFKSAVFLLAYYSEDLEDARTPSWIREKTVYLGFINKQNNATSGDGKLSFDIQNCVNVTVISGNGGNDKLDAALGKLANKFPSKEFTVLGNFKNKLKRPNVKYFGFVNSPESYLVQSDLIVSNCGLNSTSELLSLGIPCLFIAEQRPFDEQLFMCKQLQKKNLVLSLNQVLSINTEIQLNRAPSRWFSERVIGRIINTILANEQRLPEIPELWRKRIPKMHMNLNPKKVIDASLITIVYNRQKQLNNLLEGVIKGSVLPSEVIIVALSVISIPDFASDLNIRIIDLKVEESTMLPIGEARNVGARHAKESNLIFLDVDCIPSSNFLRDIYVQTKSTGGLVMGSPKYLAADLEIEVELNWLQNHSIYHPNRPEIEGMTPCDDFGMFWSLCFGIEKANFFELGGFDEDFKGYGAEDTDFSYRWLGAYKPFYLSSAEVFHQQHPIYRPPVNRLEDIIYNSRVFRKKWGRWVMEAHLSEFEKMGLINWNENCQDIEVKQKPSAVLLKQCYKEKAPFI
jgi:GT2 family glycosyltransferase